MKRKMKLEFYLILIFCFIFSFANAQRKYGGGNGDGFASQAVSNLVLAINELNISSIQVYPNPVKDVISIRSENQKVGTLTIYDTKGNIVCRFFNVRGKIRINNLSPGLYYLRVGNWVGKIIKE